MPWQLLHLAIYRTGYDAPRVVRFHTGEVNIITGSSHTGKTALIQIVNYCLGSDICQVPAGIIRDTASWFAIQVQAGEETLFIAREAPADQKGSARMMLVPATRNQVFRFSELRQTTTKDDVLLRLSRLLGIEANLIDVQEGTTRPRFTATVRHALPFVFQPQFVVASPAVLFGNIEDAWRQRALKDTFPFFLGAVAKDELNLELDLEEARRDQKRAQRHFDEVLALKAQGYERAKSLTEEARSAGFDIPAELPEELAELHGLLRRTLNVRFSTILATDDSRYDALQSQWTMERDRALSLFRQIQAAEEVSGLANQFGAMSKRHVSKLKALELLPAPSQQNAVCPVCEQVVPELNDAAETIRGMILTVQRQLAEGQAPQNDLTERIRDLRSQREQAMQRKREIEVAMEALRRNAAQSTELLSANERKARVHGRIDLYLESAEDSDEATEARIRLNETLRKVQETESKLNAAGKAERLKRALKRISDLMAEMSRELDLEHKDAELALDLDRLTVRAKLDGTWRSMAEIGSGANWVGYHLLALLALHRYFIENERPVPAFLILDQPSQVYFPPDPLDGDKGDLNKRLEGIPENSPRQAKALKDREALKAIYRLLFDAVRHSKGQLQIIVTDHANLLDEPQFQSAIREEWRDGRALIQEPWPDGPAVQPLRSST